MTSHDKAHDEITQEGPSLVWFRNDLRIADNPALHAAFQRGRPLLCLFVLEDDNGLRPLGAASRWWLHSSLAALSEDLSKAGTTLLLFSGASGTIVPDVAAACGAGALFFNRRYGASGRALDDKISKRVADAGTEVESFNGRLLNEPDAIETKAGGSYGVYTPYLHTVLDKGLPADTLPKHRSFEAARYPSKAPKPVALDALQLLPTKPNWADGWEERWQPGEAGAAKRLRDFLKEDLADYPEARDELANRGTSHLSPHLRFGEVSPRQIVEAVEKARTKATAEAVDKFLAELIWREFDYHNLWVHPDLAEKNLHDKFDAMPWRKPSAKDLKRWQRGRTGFPIVDAGMRELWQTGYMQNRLRMITASFLIKDMLADWRIGEKWFWDCLCDADPANNTMNWQWVAGSGADASPFFRVFNPVTQGERYDRNGDYVRRWVPELSKIEGKAIHAPWQLSAEELETAGVILGETYPQRMLDHGESRDRALQAFKSI